MQNYYCTYLDEEGESTAFFSTKKEMQDWIKFQESQSSYEGTFEVVSVGKLTSSID